MSLTIKHLNADASFLLTCAPPSTPTPTPTSSSTTSPTPSPTPFTILLDPWLTGPVHIFHPALSLSTLRHPPAITTLAALAPSPDLLIISQPKSDHCHEATLRTLPPTSRTLILAPPAAARLIHSWRHFDPSRIRPLAPYSASAPGTVTRIPLPAPGGTHGGAPGEITVAHLPQPHDVTGLHAAIGITYLSPSFHPHPHPSPPATLSLLFAPHGIAPAALRAYAAAHLSGPLTALLHPLATVSAPWCLGGAISPGLAGGTAIARALGVGTWVGAHDEDVLEGGVVKRWVRREGWGDVGKVLGEGAEEGTEVLVLGVGEEVVLR